MGINSTETIHEAIRGHTAKTRVERRNYGFSLGKFGFGYSVEREEPVEAGLSETRKQGRESDPKDFAAEMLKAMRRRMNFNAASGRRTATAPSGPMPLQMRAALKAYASSVFMAVQPPRPSRLLAVA
jgi:hypothetical protein